MSGYSMEVFAEARRDGIVEDVETRRLLKAARPVVERAPVARERRLGAIGRGVAWLARLARWDRHPAAS
jgi:hypothetical protein